MEILYLADGRSAIALHWIRHFIDRGHRVHLVSLYPGTPTLPLASYHTIPLAFSPERTPGDEARRGRLLRRLASPRLRTHLRHWLVPLRLPAAARRLRSILDEVQPELVHAMRVPYEGMLAAAADPQAPLLVSIWGNDFTLHAPATPLMRRRTSHTLARADGLHTDCRRDHRLAVEWGFSPEKPAVVLPTGGGVQLDVFFPPKERQAAGEAETEFVINPRGLRAYVQNASFFRAIPQVLKQRPQARFLCPAMAGEDEPRRWVRRLKIEGAVSLLPRQSRSEMAALFRRASVAVSLTTHDGTPNTLLEAMACGCLPVVGDLESLREWISQGQNGLLVDPQDPGALAEAILTGLSDGKLRARAFEHNQRLIRDRAERGRVMQSAEAFYERMVR